MPPARSQLLSEEFVKGIISDKKGEGFFKSIVHSRVCKCIRKNDIITACLGIGVAECFLLCVWNVCKAIPCLCLSKRNIGDNLIRGSGNHRNMANDLHDLQPNIVSIQAVARIAAMSKVSGDITFGGNRVPAPLVANRRIDGLFTMEG